MNGRSLGTYSRKTRSRFRLRFRFRATRISIFAAVAASAIVMAIATEASGAGATGASGALSTTAHTYRFDETVTVPSVHGTGHSPSGTLSIDLDPATGNFTGQDSRPSITMYGTTLGLIPISAVVSFNQVGALTGTIAADGSLTADLVIDIYVHSINALWILPLLSSTTCHTATPASLHATAPSGGFSVAEGGTVSSTFTVGPLADCGLQTSLLNTVIPGPGNQVTLKLSPTS